MCARSGQKKYNKLCPRKKDTEIRRERKNDFRGLDVGEGVYEGKMKNRKKLRQQERKMGEKEGGNRNYIVGSKIEK